MEQNNKNNIKKVVVRLLAVSGNSNSSSNAGAFYVNVNQNSGNRNSNYSGRLYCWILKFLPALRQPHLLVKHKTASATAGSLIVERRGGNRR